MQLISSIIFASLTVASATYSGCDKDKMSVQAHYRLKTELLCDYERTIRPVVDHQNATEINVKMIVKSLTYDMHSNTIGVNSWLGLFWKDEHLKWDPSNYEDVNSIHMNSEEIWVPDLSIYNRYDQSGSPSALNTVDCVVSYMGTVACVPPTRHEAHCLANLAKYPYDVQNCTLRFGSWVHTGEEINFVFNKRPVSLEDYTPNSEWKLLNVSTQRHSGHYKCCPNSTYPSISFIFTIERHAGFDTATVIIPALVMMSMTLATLCMYANSLDRLCLACCNLLNHILYIQYVSWNLPTVGDNPPLIVVFSRDSLLLCTFTILFTIFLKRIVSEPEENPIWISSLVSTILGSRLGQVFLYFDYNTKGLTTIRNEEDRANIIENVENSRNQDNALFVKIFDRLCLLAYSIVYFCLFIAFIV